MRHNLPSSQFVKTVKTAGDQCIPLVNRIMNSENNAPKGIVKSFIDLANMAKGLMDKNQQPYIQQELKRGEGRGGESRELHRVSAGESSGFTTTDTNTSFATPSITKRKVAEIWGSKTCGESQ